MPVRRLDAATIDAVLDTLLGSDPPPQVAAMNDNGLFVPMPRAVPLRGHPVITGVSSMLDLIAAPDIRAAIDAWTVAKETGSSMVTVHPLAAPESTMQVHVLDATHRYGTFLAVVVGLPDPGETGDLPESALRPRYGVMTKSEMSVVVGYDEGVQRMLGVGPDELVGLRTLEMTHPEDHQGAITHWMDMLAHPGQARRTRIRQRRGDGSWQWFEVTNHNLLNEPEHPHVLGEMVDVSEEMAAVEALRAGELLLRRLTEALPVGVLQLGSDGRVVYRNDRAEQLLGFPVAPGTAIAALPLEPELVAVVRTTLAAGTDADAERSHTRPDGTRRRFQVGARVLGDGPDLVTGALVCLSDVTDEVGLREELALQATYDSLTGCLTRRALLERLEDLVGSRQPVTVLFVDLDGFKEVNDRHGHAVGDALLRHVGGCLQATVRSGDALGRIGGDEFLLATTWPASEQDAQTLARATATAVGLPLLVDGLRLVARASVGVARSAGAADADELVAAADTAMYRTKTERRSTARA